MSSSTTLYKIIALYLLKRAGLPLTNSAICGFFVEGNYTDYFSAMEVLTDLSESALITEPSPGNSSITDKGAQTLSALNDRLSSEIRAEVDAFLKENSLSIKKNRDIRCNYDRATYGGFLVHLYAAEDDNPILEITIQVPDELQAKTLCTNWKEKYDEAYAGLIDSLL